MSLWAQPAYGPPAPLSGCGLELCVVTLSPVPRNLPYMSSVGGSRRARPVVLPPQVHDTVVYQLCTAPHRRWPHPTPHGRARRVASGRGDCP